MPHQPTDRPERQALDSVNHEPTELTYRRLLQVAHPLLRAFTRQDWRGREKIPQSGGLLVVSNHISHFDPVVLGHFLVWAGRWPRYLGKISLFTSPGIGWLARSCGQIPVERGTERAKDALVHAREALDAGRCVGIYPEGTVTKDPDLWPMTPKSGAARLALTSGAPVVPVAQWGAHQVLPPGSKVLRLLPRRTMTMLVGDPIDLSDLRSAEPTRAQVHEAGVRIMDALTALVAEVRQESPPVGERWDQRAARRFPWPTPAPVDPGRPA